MSVQTLRVVACYRSPFLALATLHGTELKDTVVCDLTRRGGRSFIREVMLEFVTARWPEEIIVDDRTAAHLGLDSASGQVRILPVSAAIATLAPSTRERTHRTLCRAARAHCPQLAKYVHAEPSAVVRRRWQTAKMIAVALGLAASLRGGESGECP